jgi:RNA-directed DNA polymerase
MEQHYVGKPLERYADDIDVHCRTEREAIYSLNQIKQRFIDCKLSVREVKTKIVNIRGSSEKKYKDEF